MNMNEDQANPLPDNGGKEERIDSFLEPYIDSKYSNYAKQIIMTVLKMLEEDVSRLDWKIITAAIREMQHSFSVFEPYRERRKVTVFGSGRAVTRAESFKAAEKFARRMSELGFMIITGAGHGIMHAANKGAGAAESFGLNIDLPWEQCANPVIRGDKKLINFKYFFARKLVFIKESHALALFPGGFGTLDEAFELLTLIQCGKTPLVPIVMIDVPDLNYWTKWLRFMQTSQLKNGFISRDDLHLWSITYDIDEACRIITNFYQNYHSQRWLGSRLVLRLNRQLSEVELRELNKDFSSILSQGKIEQSEALQGERDEDGSVEFPKLSRLLLHFNRRDFGRLRLMIDRINQFG